MEMEKVDRCHEILAEHSIESFDAFLILVNALIESHLRTKRRNETAARPAPTIIEAVELALKNERQFNLDYADEQDQLPITEDNRPVRNALHARTDAMQQDDLLKVLRDFLAEAERC